MSLTFAATRTTRLFRRVAQPSLKELHEAGPVFLSSENLVEELQRNWADSFSETIRGELQDLEQELDERLDEQSLVFDLDWSIERNSSRLLYTMVRLARPRIVLESGVANGQSTFFFTRALEKNGTGHLHSVDIRPNVGSLLSDRERHHWTLHLLDRKHLRGSWQAIIADLPNVDLFLHDSDHSYRWQSWEIGTIYPRLSDGACLACDDADASFAFVDFCKRIGVKPRILLDGRKAMGVLVKPHPRN